MSRTEPIDIGEAARRIGVSAATLRLYERRGLIPRAARTKSGYRQYSAEDVRRARLVYRARRAGLSMRQIAQILGHKDGSEELHRLLRAHLEHLERESRRLARLRRHLRRWLYRLTE
ncbi:MAG TPA: MerR family transcriptional regulator [Lysobacter sp.]|nr:MerR family transcriptional regulator [Lysobacter sp.]